MNNREVFRMWLKSKARKQVSELKDSQKVLKRSNQRSFLKRTQIAYSALALLKKAENQKLSSKLERSKFIEREVLIKFIYITASKS
jgi:hypothetical protein